MVEGTEGSHHKEGSRKMSEITMICAGIDTGKRKLDVAIAAAAPTLTLANDAGGHARLADFLRQHAVVRVGIEASGGYAAAVVMKLRAAGFTVIVWQPAQVRAYAKYKGQRAKNDRIDAALIAAATAAAADVHPAPDSRFAALAATLTVIEQIGEDIARLKNRCESCHGAGDARAFWENEITHLAARQRALLAQLVAAIRAHADLAQRLDLIESVDGVGLRTAVAILVRMPELGTVSRERAAALAGLAPFDADSGDHKGIRHIGGGRGRLRRALYAAALPAAFRWNAPLGVMYQRLIGRGKSHKAALIACARKLLIYVNIVVERGTPWRSQPGAALA